MTRLRRMPARWFLRSLRRPYRTRSLIRCQKNCSRWSPEDPPALSAPRSSSPLRQLRAERVRRHSRRIRRHVRARHSTFWVSEGTSRAGLHMVMRMGERTLHHTPQAHKTSIERFESRFLSLQGVTQRPPTATAASKRGGEQHSVRGCALRPKRRDLFDATRDAASTRSGHFLRGYGSLL